MQDTLGDKMKALEASSSYIHDKKLPIYVRIDGRSFSKVTKSLKNEGPYSSTFISYMVDLTEELMFEFNADIGFHQSDEISLGFLPKSNELSQYIFGGKQSKVLSLIPSFASSYLTRLNVFPLQNIMFDARSISMTYDDLLSMFLWRHKDATRNAILQMAHNTDYVSKKWMQGKSTQEVFDELSKHINWEDVSPSFRYGTFLLKYISDDTGRTLYSKHNLDMCYHFLRRYVERHLNES